MGHMDGMHGKSWTETLKERSYVALNRRLMANGKQRNVLYFGDWFIYCRVLEFLNKVLVVAVLLDVTACGGRHLQMFPDEATASFFRVEEYYYCNSYVLLMEPIVYCQTLEDLYNQAARYHTPKHINPHSHRRGKLHTIMIIWGCS